MAKLTSNPWNITDPGPTEKWGAGKKKSLIVHVDSTDGCVELRRKMFFNVTESKPEAVRVGNFADNWSGRIYVIGDSTGERHARYSDFMKAHYPKATIVNKASSGRNSPYLFNSVMRADNCAVIREGFDVFLINSGFNDDGDYQHGSTGRQKRIGHYIAHFIEDYLERGD